MSSTKAKKFQLQRDDSLVMKKQTDSGLKVRIPEIENVALCISPKSGEVKESYKYVYTRLNFFMFNLNFTSN